MEIWIISESDGVTTRIRKSLQKLDVQCPLERVVSTAFVGQTDIDAGESATVVFFAATNLSLDQFDALRKVRAKTDAKLIVVSSVSDHATVLKAIRAGANDYLNADGNLDEEIAELLSRINSERTQRTSKGRLITIVPCHVPSDASILAVNMSAVIAQHAGVCGLLDLHLRGGDLAMLLKLSPRHTVYDLLTHRDGIDDAMLQQAITQHESGIRLLAGPPLFSNLKSIQPHVCQHILNLAVSTHAFVVVNSEDVVHAEQVRALASSDDIVLTMRLDLVSLHRAQQHVEYLKRNHVPLEHVHVVAMGTGYTGELPVKAVRKVLGISSLHCIPDDGVATTMSINVGNPLVLEFPKSKTSDSIVQFTGSLTGMPEIAVQKIKRRASSGAKAAAFLAFNVLSSCK